MKIFNMLWVRCFRVRVITLALQHSVPDFQENNVLTVCQMKSNRDYLRIPSEENGFFLRSQKAVYDHMTKDDYFSYSGPTSMGKSFVMRTFIRERIRKSPDCNFAILVPTKALDK
jgi:replicative superfamily II helicase